MIYLTRNVDYLLTKPDIQLQRLGVERQNLFTQQEITLITVS